MKLSAVILTMTKQIKSIFIVKITFIRIKNQRLDMAALWFARIALIDQRILHANFTTCAESLFIVLTVE